MSAPRVASEEEAANLALGHIGEPGIAGLDDDHPAARACRRFFAAARDAALRAHDWNFAATWVIPPRVAPDSLGPLQYRFALPADWIAVRRAREDREADDDLPADQWAVETARITDGAGAEVEDAFLVTNSPAPLVGYTRRVEAVRLWDAQFTLAFSHKLAELIAPDLARNAGEAALQAAKFADALPKAKASDMSEKAAALVSRRLTSWGAARR